MSYVAVRERGFGGGFLTILPCRIARTIFMIRIASCLEGRNRRFGSGAADNGKGSSTGNRYGYVSHVKDEIHRRSQFDHSEVLVSVFS